MNRIEDESRLPELFDLLLKECDGVIEPSEIQSICNDIKQICPKNNIPYSKLFRALEVAELARQQMSVGRSMLRAILLYELARIDTQYADTIESKYGVSTAKIIQGLSKAYSLYDKHQSIENDNFRKLLLTFAEDVRVIMIMIVDRLYTMLHLSEYPEEQQVAISQEVSFLYAPMAHRMGLYAIKTILEDLALKYTQNQVYKDIAHKLNETKKSRDKYIQNFITPVEKELKKEGFSFSIKGRTKSIHSIWNKIRKQDVPFEKVYDLFAIRIIIDCPPNKEKAYCWQAFSIVTDMYTANTNRLRDWLSVPKSNGYESLHITVMGPEGKWVEVQIRTKRMDEIAEKGMAAHWKYKGGKSDSKNSDDWLKNLRDFMESNKDNDDTQVINEFKMQLYDDDVFVFTPKGDLHQIRKGATVLDFAFQIHTNIGSHCTGAIVNDKQVPMRHKLQNGDQINILTSPQQTPSRDWINIVKTTKARTKIRQKLKETENKNASDGREILLRRLKNWKIEHDDATVTRLAKKMGYKTVTSFYIAVHEEHVNLSNIKELLLLKDETSTAVTHTAETYVKETDLEKHAKNDDVLIIERNLKNIQYSLAPCCKPVYGDPVFGFVTSTGGIKIHRNNCPNAQEMRRRFPYRIIEVAWDGGNNKNEYEVRLRVIGQDDIGIVANITAIISNEKQANLRTISIDSNDGLFEGSLVVMIKDIQQVNQLMKKVKGIRGVKQVYRD